MIEIELNNIKKSYGLKNVLNGFNMEITTGERVAIVGQNGSGKSTILKVIAGEESIDDGKVNIRKGSTIGMLNQIYEKKYDNPTVKEFLFESFKDILKLEKKLEETEQAMCIEHDEEKMNNLLKSYGNYQEKYSLMGGYEMNEKFNKICSKFHIGEAMQEQNYNNLSGGEKTRANLAKLLLKEPSILILDEPTNHLDIDSMEFLEELISNYKGTVVIVSHDRYFLDKIVTKTVLLENGKESVYYGNYSYFVKEDERRTLAEFEKYKNQQKQIEKMKESIKTLRKFGELAKNEMFFKRAKSIEKKLEKMQVLDKVTIDKKSIDLNFFMEDRSGKDVLKIEHLNKSFGSKDIFKYANAQISYGEKVCLVGGNGTGKSTLIRIILGEDNQYEGVVQIGSSVKLGYIPQNIVFEDEKQTILDFFINGNNFSETEARTKLAKYGFRQENVFKKIGSLSGGEKVRIILIKLIQQDINFLILDEPTNHIDIDTRELLEEALKDYRGTVLFVSHDRFFINKLADRILNIEELQLKSYFGNYDNYRMIVDR